MTTVAWSNNVNANFFDVKEGLKDNLKKTTYLSGRNTAYLNNEKFIKQMTASLDLIDTDENPEYATFMNWYTSELIGGVNCFTCPSLAGKWKFIDNPSEERKAPHRILTISLEQV